MAALATMTTMPVRMVKTHKKRFEQQVSVLSSSSASTPTLLPSINTVIPTSKPSPRKIHRKEEATISEGSIKDDAGHRSVQALLSQWSNASCETYSGLSDDITVSTTIGAASPSNCSLSPTVSSLSRDSSRPRKTAKNNLRHRGPDPRDFLLPITRSDTDLKDAAHSTAKTEWNDITAQNIMTDDTVSGKSCSRERRRASVPHSLVFGSQSIVDSPEKPIGFAALFDAESHVGNKGETRLKDNIGSMHNNSETRSPRASIASRLGSGSGLSTPRLSLRSKLRSMLPHNLFRHNNKQLPGSKNTVESKNAVCNAGHNQRLARSPVENFHLPGSQHEEEPLSSKHEGTESLDRFLRSSSGTSNVSDKCPALPFIPNERNTENAGSTPRFPQPKNREYRSQSAETITLMQSKGEDAMTSTPSTSATEASETPDASLARLLHCDVKTSAIPDFSSLIYSPTGEAHLGRSILVGNRRNSVDGRVGIAADLNRDSRAGSIKRVHFTKKGSTTSDSANSNDVTVSVYEIDRLDYDDDGSDECSCGENTGVFLRPGGALQVSSSESTLWGSLNPPSRLRAMSEDCLEPHSNGHFIPSPKLSYIASKLGDSYSWPQATTIHEEDESAAVVLCASITRAALNEGLPTGAKDAEESVLPFPDF